MRKQERETCTYDTGSLTALPTAHDAGGLFDGGRHLCRVAGVGSGSEGVVTSPIQPDSRQKIVPVPQRESIRHASPGGLRPPGFLGHPPIDSGQKIRQLCNADRHNTVRHRRPQKAPALKPLREQARTLSIVPNNFY